MSEHDEQAKLFSWTRYRPELRWMFAIPNGGLRSKATAAKMAAEGARAGIWDICLPCPSKGYHGLFLEMKWGKNTLTPAQKEFGDYATQQGYCCKVAYSADEAIKIIDEYLELNNDRFTC